MFRHTALFLLQSGDDTRSARGDAARARFARGILPDGPRARFRRERATGRRRLRRRAAPRLRRRGWIRRLRRRSRGIRRWPSSTPRSRLRTSTARVDWHPAGRLEGGARHVAVFRWADAAARDEALTTAAALAGAPGVVSAEAAENAGNDARAWDWILDVTFADLSAARAFLTGEAYRSAMAVVDPVGRRRRNGPPDSPHTR